MREIKFRAWDWEKMSRIFTIQDIWYEWFPSMCYNFPEERDYIKESIVFMQYTWLKDKHWKEIYEWDIVDFWWANKQIVFDRWCFYMKDTEPSMVPYILDIKYHEETEIIWNIYQNPELLNTSIS